MGKIQSKQRPRARVVNGKFAQIYTPKDTTNYEDWIRTNYIEQCNAYMFPDDCSIQIVVYAKFMRPESMKKYDEYLSSMPCFRSLDGDNILKIVQDALNKIAYQDDRQIDFAVVQKMWTNEREGLEISLTAYPKRSNSYWDLKLETKKAQEIIKNIQEKAETRRLSKQEIERLNKNIDITNRNTAILNEIK